MSRRPAGAALPRRGIDSGLEFWNVGDRSLAEVWAVSPAFNAFRGTDFLPQPCASCERCEIDFGGCRSQAFLLTGDPRATDPVCHKSSVHDIVARAAEIHADTPYHYRR
jgi:PqqA peptide cyclase